jgi:cytochrome b561
MTVPNRFPLAIRLLHWAMALLILAMLFIGVAMASTAGPVYSKLLALHRPLGITILLLACLRLAIRVISRVPPLPGDLPRLQRIAASASHWLLYAGMIAMPLMGWAMLSAGGFPVALAPGVTLPPILPQSGLGFGLLRWTHGVLAIAFFGLIVGHLTTALVHGFIRRDGVLSSMGFDRTSLPRDATVRSDARDDARPADAGSPSPAVLAPEPAETAPQPSRPTDRN